MQFIYVPKTLAYCISGSAELFPQHCQVPNLSPIEHLKALTAELASETAKVSRTTKGKALLKILRTHLDDLVMPSPAPTEQRMPTAPTTSPTLPLVLQRMSDSPAILQTWDPMAKQNLIAVKRPHQQTTHNNTPGMVPAICRDMNIVLDKGIVMPTPRRLQRATPMLKPAPSVTFSPIPGRCHPITRARLISQTALNLSFITKKTLYKHRAFIPARLIALVCIEGIPNYAHFVSLMVHPVTGETISSYKKLMHNPAMVEVLQTAFGKDVNIGLVESPF
jgi:hypothetical protein